MAKEHETNCPLTAFYSRVVTRSCSIVGILLRVVLPLITGFCLFSFFSIFPIFLFFYFFFFFGKTKFTRTSERTSRERRANAYARVYSGLFIRGFVSLNPFHFVWKDSSSVRDKSAPRSGARKTVTRAWNLHRFEKSCFACRAWARCFEAHRRSVRAQILAKRTTSRDRRGRKLCGASASNASPTKKTSLLAKDFDGTSIASDIFVETKDARAAPLSARD